MDTGKPDMAPEGLQGELHTHALSSRGPPTPRKSPANEQPDAGASRFPPTGFGLEQPPRAPCSVKRLHSWDLPVALIWPACPKQQLSVVPEYTHFLLVKLQRQTAFF